MFKYADRKEILIETLAKSLSDLPTIEAILHDNSNNKKYYSEEDGEVVKTNLNMNGLSEYFLSKCFPEFEIPPEMAGEDEENYSDYLDVEFRCVFFSQEEGSYYFIVDSYGDLMGDYVSDSTDDIYEIEDLVNELYKTYSYNAAFAMVSNIQEAMALSPETDTFLLEQAYRLKKRNLEEALAKNPATPEKILSKLVGTNRNIVLDYLKDNPSTTDKIRDNIEILNTFKSRNMTWDESVQFLKDLDFRENADLAHNLAMYNKNFLPIMGRAGLPKNIVKDIFMEAPVDFTVAIGSDKDSPTELIEVGLDYWLNRKHYGYAHILVKLKNMTTALLERVIKTGSDLLISEIAQHPKMTPELKDLAYYTISEENKKIIDKHRRNFSTDIANLKKKKISPKTLSDLELLKRLRSQISDNAYPIKVSRVEKDASLLTILAMTPDLLNALGIKDPKDIVDFVKVIKEAFKTAPYLKAKLLDILTKFKNNKIKEIDTSALFRSNNIDLHKYKEPSKLEAFLEGIERSLDYIS